MKQVAIFLSALATIGTYVWLACLDVALWKILPLLVYVAWAQWWLLTSRPVEEEG
jgi:hypothetical protein